MLSKGGLTAAINGCLANQRKRVDLQTVSFLFIFSHLKVSPFPSFHSGKTHVCVRKKRQQQIFSERKGCQRWVGSYYQYCNGCLANQRKRVDLQTEGLDHSPFWNPPPHHFTLSKQMFEWTKRVDFLSETICGLLLNERKTQIVGCFPLFIPPYHQHGNQNWGTYKSQWKSGWAH